MTPMPCKEHEVCANRQGYGVVRHDGKTQLLHRLVYCQANSLSIADIKNKVIRHTCDNARCIEPTHLLIGSQLDNVQDMICRGRNSPPPHRSGGLHTMSKLTFAEVRAIRAEYQSGARQIDLARKFGVSAQNISLIVKNKIWDERVCEINARIAPLSISADGLSQLGFDPVGHERAAKLYAASDLQKILDAMVEVIEFGNPQAVRKSA